MDGLSARSLARASSGDVQKLRSNLQAQITNLRKDRGNASFTALFESIEQTLSQLRLACMQVIFHDFEYAADKKIEHILWQAHTSVNGEYRKASGRLGVQSQVVQKRKVERMYKDFLKTSQSFYCGYIQRLSGRFFIPELRQAAQGLNLQPTDMPSRDASPPDSVCKLVANSCQTSLVHLGDLARYRCQISDKSTKSTFDTALAYYGLANAVDPDNGSAHHQMAVLYQIQALHFEIVYHFHRAIAIAKPHELGLGNLEREFRGLQNPVPAQARGSADAMVTWFVRLHGFYFQGESFSLQVELEAEVLHRSERAYAADDQANTLLKMALINLASYDIATAKVKESWTSNASLTCQFLLRWAVRSIAMLLRLIKAELQAEPATILAQNAPNATESPLVFNKSLSTLLRFLRIYIAWIYTVRSDIVQYRDFLEPHISEVYRLLADSLTLLNTYACQCSDTIHSQYLLPEDIEAVGLQPLNDHKLPLFLRVEDTTDALSTEKCKTRKSRKEALGLNYRGDTETVWRIRDIVCCGILLAGSAHFPVSITVVKYPDGRKVEGWVFTDEHPAESYISEVEMSRMLDRLEGNNLHTVPDERAEQVPQPEVTRTEPVSTPAVAARDNKITALTSEKCALSLTHEARPSGSAGEIDISQDNEMVDMVNKLLDPQDNSMSKDSKSLSDTSYGMNASTADEIFGQLGHSSGQPSPVAKAIPNLPWGNFYNANWNETSAPSQGVSSKAQNYIARASVGVHEVVGDCANGVVVSKLLPGGGFVSNEPNTERSRIPSVSRKTASQKRSPRKEIQQASNEGSRNEVLESLAQALYAQHGFSPSHPNPHCAPASPSWPAGSAIFHDTGGRITEPPTHCGLDAPSYPSRALIGVPTVGDATNPPVRTQRMYHSESGHLSGNPAEPLHSGGNFSPSVISGGHARRIGSLSNGISHAGSPSGLGLNSLGRHGVDLSPWNHSSQMTAASLSFSHPSSLLASTPSAIAVPRMGVESPSMNASLSPSMFYQSEGLDPSGSVQAQASTRPGLGDVRYKVGSTGHSPR